MVINSCIYRISEAHFNTRLLSGSRKKSCTSGYYDNGWLQKSVLLYNNLWILMLNHPPRLCSNLNWTSCVAVVGRERMSQFGCFAHPWLPSYCSWGQVCCSPQVPGLYRPLARRDAADLVVVGFEKKRSWMSLPGIYGVFFLLMVWCRVSENPLDYLNREEALRAFGGKINQVYLRAGRVYGSMVP